MHNLGRVGPFRVQITNHALQRMCEMGMTGEIVQQILLSPEERSISRGRSGIVYYRRGSYTLPTAEKRGAIVVMTALYANHEAWDEALALGIIGEDRAVENFREPPSRRK